MSYLANHELSCTPRSLMRRMLSIEESIDGIHRMMERMSVQMEQLVGSLNVANPPVQRQENQPRLGVQTQERQTYNFQQQEQPRFVQEQHWVNQEWPRIQQYHRRYRRNSDSSSDEEGEEEWQAGQWRINQQRVVGEQNEYKVKLDIPTFNGKRDIRSLFGMD